MRGKVTRQCPQTTIFGEKGEPKRIRTEGLLLTSLTALPLGHYRITRQPPTGSLVAWSASPEFFTVCSGAATLMLLRCRTASVDGPPTRLPPLLGPSRCPGPLTNRLPNGYSTALGGGPLVCGPLQITASQSHHAVRWCVSNVRGLK